MKNILAIQSHVVYGHAGNSAAEFPMRRLGANVWPLNTVQFSNHTQYGKWTGCVMPPSHLTEIVQGIAAIDKLHTCDAVLSGYLGSAEQGEHILGIVRQVKAANPQAKYFCDPVMGHPENRCPQIQCSSFSASFTYCSFFSSCARTVDLYSSGVSGRNRGVKPLCSSVAM